MKRNVCLLGALILFSFTAVSCQKVQARMEIKEGNKAYLNEDYRTALNHYEEARKADPGFKELDRLIGYCNIGLFKPNQEDPQNEKYADSAIREEGLPIEPFPFTDRIGDVFARCDAVLMRAGALSIAEASLFGRPCILIPYPHSADRHQEENAREFCAGGAGVWMPQEEATAERILSAISSWVADPGGRAAAGEAAARFSRPDAAAHIVRYSGDERARVNLQRGLLPFARRHQQLKRITAVRRRRLRQPLEFHGGLPLELHSVSHARQSRDRVEQPADTGG